MSYYQSSPVFLRHSIQSQGSLLNYVVWVAQQCCGCSWPGTLLHSSAIQAIARQLRFDNRQTNGLISIISISKQKDSAMLRSFCMRNI